MRGFEEYERYDGLGLAELIAKGEVSASEVLEASIARAEARNPALRAIVTPMYDEARRVVGGDLPEGPFHGVPFLIKDLYAGYAGTRTTNASRLYAEYIADHDSELVSRQRNAGLVVIGKSATPEFGLTTTTESALHGATRNPWNLEHSSGGSSGGASSAVAAGIVPLAHATDGGGSIRIPASCCGLFGLKPTRARTPMGPDAGEGWSGMSCWHAITRSVRDSAALLDATAGPDLGAPYLAPAPSRPWLRELGASPGRLRIAVQTRAFNGAETHADCTAAAVDAARLCESLGHDVEEASIEFASEALAGATRVIIGANTLAGAEDRARQLGRELRPDDTEPGTYQLMQAGAEANAADYARAIRVLHTVGRQVAAFFERYDAILTPTMGIPPAPIGALALTLEDPVAYLAHLLPSIGFTQLFNASGSPAMSVPLYWNAAGLPIGVQFAAGFGDEATLLRLAAQLEEARPWLERRPDVAALESLAG